MALVLKDRIKETTTTSGTGTYTLAGAETGFEAFSVVGDGNTTYYCCTDGTSFEIGVGTYTLSGTTLARTTILQSSNSDSAVDWASDNAKTIFCTYPGDKAVFLNASNQLVINGTAVTSTAAELNILDGVTSTASELNIMDGVTSTAAELNIMDGDTSATSTTVADADRVVLNDNGTMVQVAVTDLDTYVSGTTKTLTNKTLTTPVIAEITSGSTITLNATTDIVLDADGANVTFKDNGTSILDIANNSSDVELTVSTADKNFLVKGTDGASAITALDIDMALAGKATFNGDVVVGGDLTVTGDDITMGTNTSGNILVADGTNFNSVAAGDLAEISTIANDDVFLAVDTSGGGLKKVARSTVVSGLATSGAISNVVEDTSPQLGANLDTNSHNILIDDAHFIADENTNEQIIFQTTSSAVNQFDITNAATGNPPKLSATGDDSNVDLDLEAKGTGHVTVRGNTNPGSIQFNCENNSHGQIVKSQAHSEGVTNVLTLPAGADSTLLSAVSTATLTNKSFGDDVLIKTSDGAILKLQTSDTTVADGDVIGAIEFSAPDDGSGTDAILTAASIVAEADATFAADANNTDLVFKLGASEAAAEKMRLTHEGKLTINSAYTLPAADGSNGHVLKTDGSGNVSFGAVSGGVAADDISTGDAATTIATSAGNITIDAQGNDTDIIFKGTDGGSDTTFLTIDGSEAGAATFNNDVTAFSDKRLKENVQTIENGLDKVCQLRGVTYNRNDQENARKQIGVIAQEVEEVLPEVVLTADDEMKTKSVDYAKITAVLIEAIKELKQEIKELKAK